MWATPIYASSSGIAGERLFLLLSVRQDNWGLSKAMDLSKKDTGYAKNSPFAKGSTVRSSTILGLVEKIDPVVGGYVGN